MVITGPMIAAIRSQARPPHIPRPPDRNPPHADRTPGTAPPHPEPGVPTASRGPPAPTTPGPRCTPDRHATGKPPLHPGRPETRHRTRTRRRPLTPPPRTQRETSPEQPPATHQKTAGLTPFPTTSTHKLRKTSPASIQPQPAIPLFRPSRPQTALIRTFMVCGVIRTAETGSTGLQTQKQRTPDRRH